MPRSSPPPTSTVLLSGTPPSPPAQPQTFFTAPLTLPPPPLCLLALLSVPPPLESSHPPPPAPPPSQVLFLWLGGIEEVTDESSDVSLEALKPFCLSLPPGSPIPHVWGSEVKGWRPSVTCSGPDTDRVTDEMDRGMRGVGGGNKWVQIPQKA